MIYVQKRAIVFGLDLSVEVQNLILLRTPRMFKISIYADFRKNNSVAIAVNADCRPR